MASTEKIIKSRKRKLLLDTDIYELDPEDRSPVASPPTIIIPPSDEDLDESNVSQESETFDNLSGPVIFDKTVGPGVAPEGFILIDEDVGVDETDNSHSQMYDASSETLRPIFKVMFRDIDIARKHGQAIEAFLLNLLSATTKSKGKYDPSGSVLEIWDQQGVSEEQEATCSTVPDNNQSAAEDQLFVIDTQPKLKDDLDIPTYGKKFERVLEKHAEKIVANLPEDHAPKLSCFNCLGNHNLRDCIKPRNHANINRNRKEFTANMKPRNGRYHLEEEQKFGHFVPGHLSKNLRKALGLRDNELPRHIYSMRLLGYPPGWMEEARVQHSGLTLFNSEGNADLDPTDEEGEIIVAGEKDEFDIKKIYDFPGFNVVPPHGTRDEYKYFGTPRMQEMHSKEVMLSRLSGRKVQDGYQRKKMKVNRSGTVKNTSISPIEMEIADIEDDVVATLAVNELCTPPLPTDTPPKPDEPPEAPQNFDSQSQNLPSPNSTQQNTVPSSRAGSPSLSDLEIAKKQLLAELDEPALPSDPGKSVNVGNLSTISNHSDSTGMPPPCNAEHTPQSTRIQNRENNSHSSNTGAVKSINLGTPVLQSTSPYNRLPSSEKFSKDICDVLNFENLPDSTGQYEKMSEIIQKVRGTVSKLQQE
ncbi:zinc finger CCHC domain-containing protein 8 homolog isoform X1 [Neodiprion fabricii]|uniref:zinc finger CCHC domain-containing protein 8 homolog isoform X1 n=1 Tax=Neodiprion fabricii TaxID=2872261 RepID=UPI001ED96149|nr:zinc finger CCHC domain-containing protein 8 homolog isoform X1 [Neodiprion fabricii]